MATLLNMTKPREGELAKGSFGFPPQISIGSANSIARDRHPCGTGQRNPLHDDKVGTWMAHLLSQKGVCPMGFEPQFFLNPNESSCGVRCKPGFQTLIQTSKGRSCINIGLLKRTVASCWFLLNHVPTLPFCFLVVPLGERETKGKPDHFRGNFQAKDEGFLRPNALETLRLQLPEAAPISRRDDSRSRPCSARGSRDTFPILSREPSF